MITEPIRSMLNTIPYLFVATADQAWQPHIAIGAHTYISGDDLLIFENWFCPITLHNITCNSHVSVVAVNPDTGTGYQMIGSIIRNDEAASLNPSVDIAETSQVLTRFTVRINKILELNGSIHSDLPLAD